MRHLRKLLFVLGAILGVILLGVGWLLHSALGAAEDVVDTTANMVDTTTASVKGALSSAQKEKASAHKENVEAVDVTPAAPSDVVTASAKTPVPTGSTPTASTKDDKSVKSGTADTKGKPEEENDLAEVGQLFKLFLDGDSADLDNLDAVVTSSDKTKDDDSFASMLPGADSPTVKGIMEGKYKGKESQIIDDALEDPKAWRLVFFLSGM